MPRRSLTSAAVDRLKPPTKGQVEHFDKGFPGLALRVSYGGGKSWSFHYRIDGHLRRLSLGTYPALSLADAREAWRRAREDVAKGRDPSNKREKPSHDFAAVAHEWLRRDQADNRTHSQVIRVVERELIPAWGQSRIDAIGRRDVLDLLDAISDRGSPIMARRVHAYVRRLFRWAVGRGIIEASPIDSLPMQGSETRRDRVLSDDELVAVWHAASDWPFGAIVRLLILTGARRGEIAGLQWAEIAGKNLCLSGERTKNARPHIIHLSVPAATILTEMPRIAGSTFAFGLKPPSASGLARSKAGLDVLVGIPTPWRLHDLRRTVATGMQRLGVVLQVVEAILGHTGGSRGGVVGIYQRHDYAKEKRAALAAWGAYVMALVEGRRPGNVLPLRGKR